GVALQRILGHSSMTMRYAHLTPEHLESAMRFSPITQSGYKLTT
ncbi:phage integrase, partial [Pseudomonas aeruginosa]